MNLCTTCGKPMRSRVGDYNYSGAGLPGILLQNVRVWRCPEGHVDVTIPAIGQLHEMISKFLLRSNRELTGAQFRFITSATMLSEVFLSRALAVSVEDLRAMRKGTLPVPAQVRASLCDLMGERPFNHVSVDELLDKGRRIQSADSLASEMVIPAPLLGRNARVRLSIP